MFSTALFALSAPVDMVGYLKWILIIAGIVAVVYIVLRVLGISIPAWVVQIFWVVVAVFVGIVAINFLAAM